MNGPDMYELHEHTVATGNDNGPDYVERHSHSVHQGHSSNWSNREHEGVRIMSWAEHGDRYRRQT